MYKKFFATTLALSASMLTISAHAANIGWTDWTKTSQKTASGTMAFGSDNVSVGFSSSSDAYFIESGATDNWWGNAYTKGTVSNLPSSREIIGLSTGGTVEIKFSETVLNPYIALVSWNANNVDFGDTKIKFDSTGLGKYGSGSPTLYSDGTGFTTSNFAELHGVIILEGLFDSFSFTHTSEGWHGFTVGAAGIAPVSEVPIPAAAFMFAPALLGFMGLRRKAKQAA
ncbi:MAG TPA: hypothetical protein EYM37_01775 [Methylophaga aminisulfidivorans]|jgi:hypothetical protein|uniref:hypothetical protein n=1 Tax=Methylophaga TaxID=40222 RepID=UPI00175E4B64|nr:MULTISPECIES: hypothetical protein [Methylophaga]WVI84998.1 hypothetical protein VSX76_14625 [Methylophaga thalassica]HIC48071.1 hypothetical protein [Methylophaga sp.]HIM38647.1 hypothetical protein [Methylophaga aminisulfidivorans]